MIPPDPTGRKGDGADPALTASVFPMEALDGKPPHMEPASVKDDPTDAELLELHRRDRVWSALLDVAGNLPNEDLEKVRAFAASLTKDAT